MARESNNAGKPRNGSSVFIQEFLNTAHASIGGQHRVAYKLVGRWCTLQKRFPNLICQVVLCNRFSAAIVSCDAAAAADAGYGQRKSVTGAWQVTVAKKTCLIAACCVWCGWCGWCG